MAHLEWLQQEILRVKLAAEPQAQPKRRRAKRKAKAELERQEEAEKLGTEDELWRTYAERAELDQTQAYVPKVTVSCRLPEQKQMLSAQLYNLLLLFKLGKLVKR